MLYVYCERLTPGAFELISGLGATRLRKFDGLNFWDRGKRSPDPKKGDTIICWGGPIPDIDDIKMLNAGSALSKFEEWQLLTGYCQVPNFYSREQLNPKQAKSNGVISRNLRSNGLDIILDNPSPDYYTYKYNLATEVKIHVFGGKVVRAGVKEVKPGFKLVSEAAWLANYLTPTSTASLAHPWVRTDVTGWQVRYGDYSPNSDMKGFALAAVKAMHLQFGAVTLGYAADNVYMVISVDRGPILDSEGIDIYLKNMLRWLDGKSAIELEVKTKASSEPFDIIYKDAAEAKILKKKTKNSKLAGALSGLKKAVPEESPF